MNENGSYIMMTKLLNITTVIAEGALGKMFRVGGPFSKINKKVHYCIM
jgi:hypothetical protein